VFRISIFEFRPSWHKITTAEAAEAAEAARRNTPLPKIATTVVPQGRPIPSTINININSMMMSLLGDSNENHINRNSSSSSSSSNDNSLDGLKERLAQIRKKRRHVARIRHECQRQHSELLLPRLNHLRLQRQVAIETYQSILVQRQSLAQYLNLAGRWNVLNDCFHIWHAGPWATINGARLGGEAPRLPPDLIESSSTGAGAGAGTNGSATSAILPAAAAAASPNNPTAPPPRRYFLWSSVAPAPDGPAMEPSSTASASPSSIMTNTNTNNTNTNNTNTNNTNSNTIQNHPSSNNNINKVPWPEINAALGHVVLLLQLLQDRCGWTNCCTHELIPMASTSQIGIRRRAPKSLLSSWAFSNDDSTTNDQQPLLPPVIHNLYFEESSFVLFKGGALRQFNIALGALLECLVQIQTQQTQQTQTASSNTATGTSSAHSTMIVLPHAIQLSSPSSNTTTTTADHHHHQHAVATIGGIPFQYSEGATSSGGAAVEFTRACKYLLTDLKWLVAHAVKHHVVQR
jgi:hypothetical protein